MAAGPPLTLTPAPDIPVPRCEPMIPDLTERVAELNRTNALDAFTRGIRRAFAAAAAGVKVL